MMCAHCEELQAEVEWLKSELGLVEDEVALDALRRTGLSPACARIVLALYSRRGRVVSRFTLDDLLPNVHGHERESTSIVGVLICRIRKLLPEGGLETLWGKGYSLTPGGMAWVADKLPAAAERVAA